MIWRKIFRAPQDEAIDTANVRARSTFKGLWRELFWEYRRIVPRSNSPPSMLGSPTGASVWLNCRTIKGAAF